MFDRSEVPVLKAWRACMIVDIVSAVQVQVCLGSLHDGGELKQTWKFIVTDHINYCIFLFS